MAYEELIEILISSGLTEKKTKDLIFNAFIDLLKDSEEHPA